MPSLEAALHVGPVVLDGGLATQLEAIGHDLSDELWSARILADDPDAIVASHRAFLDAGASVITTASYQATLAGFERRGHTRDEATSLIRRSVALARTAGAGRDRPLWIAASVGPYGAALADGSEYRGNYGLSHTELVRFHKPRLEILAEAEPDVLALETVPDIREAEALLTAIDGLGIPAWLSYTVDGDRTRAGQPVSDAFALGEHPAIIAVGVNCSSPEDATAAVPLARQVSGKPVVVYPNSGETWDAMNRRWHGTAHASAAARAWVDQGARLVGGCCRVFPREIADIAKIQLRGQDS
jgi:homocysteine S-methyltransferase